MKPSLTSDRLNEAYLDSFLPRPVLLGLNKKPRLIGRGVWGVVIDVTDGTVIKLCPPKGGIGDAREKLDNEIAFLRRIKQIPGKKLLFPLAVDNGDIPEDSPAAQDGFAFWARNSKVPGRFISGDEFNASDQKRRQNFAITLGRALAEFHAMWDNPVYAESLKLNNSLLKTLDELKDYTDRDDDKRTADALAGMIKDISEKHICVIHGDVNVTNIFVRGGWTVAGFIDFAESGIGFPEADFAHTLMDMPDVAPLVLAAYQKSRGITLDRRRLAIASAVNALVGAVINGCIYSNRADERDCRTILAGEMAKLDIMPMNVPLRL